MECSVQGCIRGVFAKGLCHPHYDQERQRQLGPCGIEGCERPQHANGLCGVHYRAAKRATAAACAVAGCGRAAVSKGLCDSHRKRQERWQHLDPTRAADWGAKVKHPLYDSWAWQKREATNVGLAAEWRDFWRFVRDVGERPSSQHKLRRVDDTQPIGPQNFEWRLALPLTEFSTRKEWSAAWAREYRARNPTKHRSAGFKGRYGIDYDAYRAMHEAQGGLCLICRRPETSLNQHTHEPRLLSVDHCHGTGKVRGLLCKRCNTGIGAFEEDPELLKAAIRYVRKYKNPSGEG